MNLFDPNSLNIFCDASIYKHHEGLYTGCPGAIAVHDNQVIDNIVSIRTDSTNNNSEITAISYGVILMAKYYNQYDTIRIFSDSKICVFGLREWIFKWVNCINNGVMFSSSGQPVMNQNIFLGIAQFIINNGYKFELYHQKGHVTGTDASIKNAQDVFLKSNNLYLYLFDIEYLSGYNNCIDQLTRDTLNAYLADPANMQQIKGNSVEVSKGYPLNYGLLSNTDIRKYKSLLRRDDSNK